MSGTTLAIIIVVAVVVVLVLLAVLLFSRRRRQARMGEQRERTREEFGSEYDRTARERGSEEEAEKELRERRGRVERRVEPLSDEGRRRYEERWGQVEQVFVDNPDRAVEMADRTVSDLLEERNFVADAAQSDEETDLALAAVYPDVADDYREARGIRAEVVSRGSAGSGEGATEDLRQAIRMYRSVYERLASD